MADAVPKEELRRLHSLERDDYVPGRPHMTEFRRRLRYHQAWWREVKGHPVGTQPIAPKPGAKSRLVGSRLPLPYAQATGANLLTPRAFAAARARTATAEAHQTLDRQRLWADLLWSPTLAFSLFGDLAGDLALADRAVHAWWPDAPGTVCEVRFAHSPGRLDPTYLGTLRTFDAAFVLDLDDGTHGIVAVDTRYHDRAKPETPRPENLRRYLEVAQRSGAFRAGSVDSVKGKTDLATMWLEHLLLFSMLQHKGGSWRWGRYVVVYPSGNADYDDLCARYRTLLAEESTFSTMTLEHALETNALPKATVALLRERYIVR